MIYILSLLGILVENSLPIHTEIYIFYLTFISYLAVKGGKKNILILIIIAILTSLQTDSLFINIFYVGSVFFLFKIILDRIAYEIINIAIITIFQTLIYIFMIKFRIDYSILIVNIVGFILLNMLYIKLDSKKK